METLVFSVEDRYKGGWPVSRMVARQGDGCSFRHTSSDASEQMHAIGGFYLPADMLQYGSHISTGKLLSFATSKIESGLSTYNNMKYPTVRTWHHGTPTTPSFSQMKHQSRDINWGAQGCSSGSDLFAQTVTKARNYEIMGQVICRYSSSCLVGRKGVLPKRDELPVCRATSLARASSLTHSLQCSKTSKQSSNRTSPGTGQKERPEPVTQKFSSCKDCTDDSARGILYLEGDARMKSVEPMHKRLSKKAPQSAEKIDCNMPQTVPLDRYETLSKQANCIKKYGRESLSSMDDACPPLNAAEAKAVMCQSSTSPNKDLYKDHCVGLISSHPVVTSASTMPPSVRGCLQESSHSAAMHERWAGPAFSNSPPPSSLPVPSFTRRQSGTSPLEIPRAQAEFLMDSICVSAPGSPSCSFSLPNAGAFSSRLDTNHATQSLRRLLNLDAHA